jgi:hypothetical protein
MAGGRTTEEGAFYGIDLLEGDGEDGARLQIAFETKTAPGSGTSPAISADGTRVYAFGGAGEIFAIDATTGEVVFEQPVGGMQASPSVSPDGAVYILAGAFLKKLDGATGEVIWSRNYDELARERLPTVSSWWPFVKTGEPVARLDSVITIAPNAVWTTLLCGYELRIAGRELVQATRSWLVAVDPEQGDVLASYPIPDTSDGAISVGQSGEIYLDLLALQASIAANAPYARWLPREMRTNVPAGGLVAFAPRSRTAHVGLGLGFAGDQLARAPVHGPSERLRNVRAQLEAAQWLGLGLEVSPNQTREIGQAIEATLGAIHRCESGDRGQAGCGRLAADSRELRLLRSVLQRDTAN